MVIKWKSSLLCAVQTNIIPGMVVCEIWFARWFNMPALLRCFISYVQSSSKLSGVDVTVDCILFCSEVHWRNANVRWKDEIFAAVYKNIKCKRLYCSASKQIARWLVLRWVDLNSAWEQIINFGYSYSRLLLLKVDQKMSN